MKLLQKPLFIMVVSILLLFVSTRATYAIANPFVRANNFIGIHILFPSELEQARKLVNSSGGDWGYVTIPIQIADQDLDKWQKFMYDCAKFHLIPIVRLATEPNWKDTGTWRKPTDTDIVDMANFLNSLVWPTKNRYVILFNEVNRSDEWGGEPPDPANYSALANLAVDTFKSRSEDFFIILAGLDNAAPNDGVKYVSDRAFLTEMSNYDSTVFDRVDGFASHSYPNPNFSAYPSSTNAVGVATYKWEYDFINSFTNNKKPVFITETGWNADYLTEKTVAFYFQKTLTDIWSQDSDKIVAITPFLLESGSGPFDKFSFLKNGQETVYYKTLTAYPKIQGNPDINPLIIPSQTFLKPNSDVLGVKTFREKYNPNELLHTFIFSSEKLYIKSLLGYGILW